MMTSRPFRRIVALGLSVVLQMTTVISQSDSESTSVDENNGSIPVIEIEPLNTEDVEVLQNRTLSELLQLLDSDVFVERIAAIKTIGLIDANMDLAKAGLNEYRAERFSVPRTELGGLAIERLTEQRAISDSLKILSTKLDDDEDAGWNENPELLFFEDQFDLAGSKTSRVASGEIDLNANQQNQAVLLSEGRIENQKPQGLTPWLLAVIVVAVLGILVLLLRAFMRGRAT